MDINHNKNCYNFKELNYNRGFLDSCVDATYIIHLENNGRLEHISNQLKEYHPTKNGYENISKFNIRNTVLKVMQLLRRQAEKKNIFLSV